MEPKGITKNARLVLFTPEEQKLATASIGQVVGITTPADMEDASLLTKAIRLRRELATWAKAGLPLATKAVRRARLAVCATCEYYDAKGNWGMGACKAPGCGCSRVKAALATSTCPKAKWPA